MEFRNLLSIDEFYVSNETVEGCNFNEAYEHENDFRFLVSNEDLCSDMTLSLVCEWVYHLRRVANFCQWFGDLHNLRSKFIMQTTKFCCQQQPSVVELIHCQKRLES